MKKYKYIFIILATMCVAVFLTISSITKSNWGIKLNSLVIKAIADDSEGGGGGVDYRCRCRLTGGGTCASNNLGFVCAPQGTAKCWEYNQNCDS